MITLYAGTKLVMNYFTEDAQYSYRKSSYYCPIKLKFAKSSFLISSERHYCGGRSETTRVSSYKGAGGRKKKRSCTYTSQDYVDFVKHDSFFAWMTGLLQGDGSFLVSNQGYGSVEVALHEREVVLLHKLKKFASGGKIEFRKKSRGVRLRWHNNKVLSFACWAVHTHLRDVKFDRYLRFWQALRVKNYDVPLVTPVICRVRCSETYWTTGYFEADGHFAINRRTRQLNIRIGSKTRTILDEIALDFGGGVYYDIASETYVYSSPSTKSSLDVWLDYFDCFPIKGPKRVEEVQFRRIRLFLERDYDKLSPSRKRARFDRLADKLQNLRD